jgi:hypothetical protein
LRIDSHCEWDSFVMFLTQSHRRTIMVS